MAGGTFNSAAGRHQPHPQPANTAWAACTTRWCYWRCHGSNGWARSAWRTANKRAEPGAGTPRSSPPIATRIPDPWGNKTGPRAVRLRARQLVWSPSAGAAQNARRLVITSAQVPAAQAGAVPRLRSTRPRAPAILYTARQVQRWREAAEHSRSPRSRCRALSQAGDPVTEQGRRAWRGAWGAWGVGRRGGGGRAVAARRRTGGAAPYGAFRDPAQCRRSAACGMVAGGGRRLCRLAATGGVVRQLAPPPRRRGTVSAQLVRHLTRSAPADGQPDAGSSGTSRRWRGDNSQKGDPRGVEVSACCKPRDPALVGPRPPPDVGDQLRLLGAAFTDVLDARARRHSRRTRRTPSGGNRTLSRFHRSSGR